MKAQGGRWPLAGLLCWVCACIPHLAATSRPHIFLIVADDLGWNDFSWRDPTIHSPVLQKLSQDGVVLNQSYVQPVCSPTRGAFMSGFYPFHIGLQHESLRATQQAYMPADIDTLPQRLKRLGYSTHMAGKWHLGFCNWKYTPTYRGFDSFMGFYNAVEDYYTHIGHRKGYDFRLNEDVYYAANGTYSAYLLTRYVQDLIEKQNDSEPLFVYLPFQSVHGPLQVPRDYVTKYCSHIQDSNRRAKCGMIAILDEAVGNITDSLQRRGMLNNTLLLFTTDNGGPINHGANNWPLRGSKGTLWEGGTRAAAFLHAPMLLNKTGYLYDGMIHAVDWLPTLLEAAGGDAVTGLDGVSQWRHLVQGLMPSARAEFVYNIDELSNNSALRQGRFKLIQGDPGNPSGWYPPPSRQREFSHSGIHTHAVESLAVRSDTDFQVNLNSSGIARGRSPPSQNSHALSFASENLRFVAEGTKPGELYRDLRRPFPSLQDYDAFDAEEVSPGEVDILRAGLSEDFLDAQYQLYDLEADPTERVDVKDKYPDEYKQMRERLDEYWKTRVPANFPPHDPASDPSNFNGVWSPGWC